MAGDILDEIIETCLSLEKKAGDIFRIFAGHAGNDEERCFWETVAGETRHHSDLLDRVREAGGAGVSSLVVYKPHETREELEMIGKSIDDYLEQYQAAPDPAAACLLGFRLQLYLLHPSFASLCRMMRDVTGEAMDANCYGAYLRRFIDGVAGCCPMTPEIELLGEALFRLWSESRQLAAQSHIDALTGVLTRAGFFRAISSFAHAAQRSGSTVAIMLIDIDYFKLISENYGHQTGDRLLQVVADTIVSHLRRSDIVGRFNGDEFIVYLSPVEPGALQEVAEKLRLSIAEASARLVSVTVSIGIAFGTLGAEVDKGVEDLVRRADECQMQAKYTGKNKVVMK
ncbi:GGDEF domain-containing protein [Geotalea uraniireducens]|uniref:diguanylate cyclase n=1 Tax=Geotalea uraniireducens TaxID=351604 RepID=A0ABM8EGY9_9BACT|nr:GGDEF domain-containing protein [Geotalea uraniireducens]BDV41689.1 GGDEF domain-containing protein [Geotalea uraniireducens]